MKRFRDTKYFVTEDGKIWSEHTKRFLSPCNNNGYQNVSICEVINRQTWQHVGNKDD